MTKPLLIAGDTVRGLLHQRLLVALMLLVLGLTAIFSVLATKSKDQILEMAELSAEVEGTDLDEEQLEQARRSMDAMGSFFLGALYWFTALGGSLVALHICCTAVAKDSRRGTIPIILAKPVSRTQFLLGKYCGAISVLFAYSVLIAVALIAFTYANQLDMNVAARYAPWLMFCQSLMVGSVGLLLSLFIHPLIAAIVALFASSWFFSPPNPLYFILPSYDRFNVFMLIADGTLITLEDVAILTLYAFDVTAIFLLLALWRFRSKEVL